MYTQQQTPAPSLAPATRDQELVQTPANHVPRLSRRKQQASPPTVEPSPWRPAASTSPHYRSGQRNDSIAIQKVVLDYIDGFYRPAATRLSQSAYPITVKHVITEKEVADLMLRNMEAPELVFHTQEFKLSHSPAGQSFRAKIRIFDISHCVAAVEVTYSQWMFFDYLQLRKRHGEWRIIHMLWAQTKIQ